MSWGWRAPGLCRSSPVPLSGAYSPFPSFGPTHSSHCSSRRPANTAHCQRAAGLPFICPLLPCPGPSTGERRSRHRGLWEGHQGQPPKPPQGEGADTRTVLRLDQHPAPYKAWQFRQWGTMTHLVPVSPPSQSASGLLCAGGGGLNAQDRVQVTATPPLQSWPEQVPQPPSEATLGTRVSSVTAT